MAPPSLLGPPALRHTNPKILQTLPQRLQQCQSYAIPPTLYPTSTQQNLPNNLSPSLSSTPNFPTSTPTLDLFFISTTDLKPDFQTQCYLVYAWQHDPLTALKLIFNLSLVNKDAFFSAVQWLKEDHLETLSLNIQNFARFGCLNVLPQLLNSWVLEKKARLYSRYPYDYNGLQTNNKKKKKTVKKNKRTREMVEALRKKRYIIRTKRAVKIYKSNSDYRYLFVCVADLFAKLLKSDIEYLKLGEIQKISMASKWCPSLDSLQDQRTLLCEGIARRVFPRDSDPEYKDIEEVHYADRVRNRLWQEVLDPLRKALRSAKKSESEPPTPALSDAMKKLYVRILDKGYGYGSHSFSKMYEDKYNAYLEIANQWEKESKLLLPNEIVANLNNGSSSEVVECEWQRLVRHMENKGRLKNCLAIWDTSKTIEATQIDICASMGILISELSDEPWKGKVITCSKNPKLCKIEGDNLQSKIEFMKGLECDGNLDFQKVFDLLFEVSEAKKLSPSRMVKTVYVLGFQQEGDTVLPEIVCWNPRDSPLSLLARKKEGVAMVRGVSKGSLTTMLEENVVPSLEDLLKSIPKPEELMESAISEEDYNDLIVFD